MRFIRLVLFVAVAVGLPLEASCQQPGQPILPQVEPGVQPSAFDLCFPRFEPNQRALVRSCQSFAEKIPVDFVDQQVRLALLDFNGLFRFELPPSIRLRYDALLPPERVPSKQVDGSMLHASRLLWETYLNALSEGIESSPRTPWGGAGETRSTGETMTGRGVNQNQTAVDKRAWFPPEPLEAIWSRGNGPLLSAPISEVRHFEAGQRVAVRVGDVVPRLGMLWPDPVLLVFRLSDRRAPERGELVAWCDEDESGEAKVVFDVDRTADYRFVVAPYRYLSGGRARLYIAEDGKPEERTGLRPFGGVLLEISGLAGGDRIFAGGGVQGRDVVLQWWSTPTEGGVYVGSNNSLSLYPEIVVPEASAISFVLLSAFDEVGAWDGTLYLSRCGTPSQDEDADGLDRALEARLGTCDNREDALAGVCDAPKELPDNWSPVDTDNDGLEDGEEIFGIRRCYGAVPLSPYFQPGQCERSFAKRCSSRCTPSARMVVELPLSSMDSPSPTRYDIYLEYDFWKPRDLNQQEQFALTPAYRKRIERAFNRWYVHDALGKPGFSDTGDYPISLHLYADEGIPVTTLEMASHLPAAATRYLFFDWFFTPARKYSGAFHYVISVHRGAGQSDHEGRVALVGSPWQSSFPGRFIHEVGHLLGLLHNGRESWPNYSPFYLSTMNYGYTYTLPPPVQWDGEFKRCTKSEECPANFKCMGFSKHGRRCAPDCGIMDAGANEGEAFDRFSSGQLPLPDAVSEEGLAPESGFPEWFLPYLYCYNDASGRTTLVDRFERFQHPTCPLGRCVQCVSASCRIDWNHDGQFQPVKGFDLDHNRQVESWPLGDHDDREIMIRYGRIGLSNMVRKSILLFYASFSDGSSQSVLPYPWTIKEEPLGTVLDLTNLCDEAARWSFCRNEQRGRAAFFRGPASGDRGIEVSTSEACAPLDMGVGVSIRVKPLHLPPKAYPAVLFDSEYFRLTIHGEKGEGVWTATIVEDEGTKREVKIRDPLALGVWTRLTLKVSNGSETAEFWARRKTVRLQTVLEGVRLTGRLCRFVLGGAMDDRSSYTGFLDDPMITTGPAREL